MKVTLCHALTMVTTEYDVVAETKLLDLLTLAMVDLSLPSVDCTVLRGFLPIAKTQDGEKTLQSIGIVENDLLTIMPTGPNVSNNQLLPTAGTSNQTSATAGSNFVLPPNLANAIASMKLPPVRKRTEDEEIRRQARELFKAFQNERERARAYRSLPGLVQQYQKAPKDYDAFLGEFRKAFSRLKLKEKLMQDPNSAEGQKLIQEEINKTRINYSLQQAYEHHPEYFINTPLLYVKLSINGTDLNAMVDTGAQLSILSYECAQRCGLEDLIDRSHKSVVRGVGGLQEVVGKIHLCNVRIKDHHFACSFSVIRGKLQDVLIGLNVLRIHRCTINLSNNTIVMGDGTTTTFLNEQEVAEISENMNNKMINDVVPDEQKITSLMEMGFSRNKAVSALKRSNNDVKFATDYLYETIGAPTEEKETIKSSGKENQH